MEEMLYWTPEGMLFHEILRAFSFGIVFNDTMIHEKKINPKEMRMLQLMFRMKEVARIR